MNPTADHEARRRFAQELDQNFSVIASAGSGKTRAISDRVVEMARRRPEWLPHLVIVTYTNRAADEMQQRTRQQILEARLPLEVIEAFARAFFGTIHSFCVKLLSSYGYHLGLAANLELITDDEDLWDNFVQQYTTVGRCLTTENRRVLLRHMRVRELMELARRYQGDLDANEPDRTCPDTTFDEVYRLVQRNAPNIPKAQEELRRWEKRWRETDEFVPWPPCASTAKEFVQRWRDAFRPLREWINACALCVAAEIQRDYREFRLDRGAVTYSDQIALAAELLRLPEVAQIIREKGFRIILDEAQDTDPAQFFVLIEIARPPDADGPWSGDREAPPRPGHFCMVGDFQQSIYRSPSDLAHYRTLHEALVSTDAAVELKFSVTFRLDQAQLDFVNETFVHILNDTDGQVQFVDLKPRAMVLPGQVIRLDLGKDVSLSLPEAHRAAMESAELAEWLRKTGLTGLRARSWSQVAILCPRKAWLRSLRNALLAENLPIEIQSETERFGEHPAYAWLVALVTVMADPQASYEIVGVLREIFGISDDELARFADGRGGRFQIGRKIRARGTVADTLNSLVRLRDALVLQPLFTTVQEIVRVTQLRERLRSLPASEYGNVIEELEKLLSLAAAAEARKSSLADFARTLRRNFNTTRETHPSAAEGIQLITAHKAKGSEWDAVILPFLAREVRIGGLAYPRILEGERPQIAFDRTDVVEIEEQVDRTARQEMERLLYVALTRARHSLVLAADQEYFLGSKGQVHTDTQFKWLRAETGDVNAETFLELPTDASVCSETASAHRRVQAEQVPDTLVNLRLHTGWFDLARQNAGAFIRTISPSKFEPEEKIQAATTEDIWMEIEPELRPPRIDNPATRYGLWWHDFAERIPWGENNTRMEAVFQRSIESSPDMARSKREWQLLQERISSGTELGRRLKSATFIRSEMPFFWRMEEFKCLEGVIDLALFDSAAGEAFIIDWKTNRIPPERLEDLRVLYRPQLAAYWKAVSEFNKMRTQAAIYSTSTGEVISFTENELADEWNRIRNLAASEFETLVAGN